MSRLTLRLPETLHTQLKALAHSENVSLNQYIVYALTRQAAMAYSVQAVPESAIREQRQAYTALLQSLGPSSFDEIEQVLAEREPAGPGEGLSPQRMEQLRARIQEHGKAAG